MVFYFTLLLYIAGPKTDSAVQIRTPYPTQDLCNKVGQDLLTKEPVKDRGIVAYWCVPVDANQVRR